MRMAHPPRSGIRPHLIDINLQLAPIRQTNTRAPAFNLKKAHWDEFEKFISCCFLISTFLTQLLARRILPATHNFLTTNPPKTLPTSTLPTTAHTSLNKLPGSLLVLSIAS